MNANEHELLLNRRKQRERRLPIFGRQQNSFFYSVSSVCVLSAKQQFSSFVCISGFDFVNLCRKTRLRGIAARRPAYRGSEQILNIKISTPILPYNFYAAILQPLSLTAAAILNPQLLYPRQRVEIYIAACKNDAGAFSDKVDL